MYLIKIGGGPTSIALSEQQMVSCVIGSGYVSQGCNGGYSDEAINYVAAVNQTKRTLWPYSGSTGSCNQLSVATASNTVKLTGRAVRIASNNEQVRRRSQPMPS
jgi:hypothetical protein